MQIQLLQFFGGQKYGYRPIPTVILGSEFLTLREALQSMNIDTILLDTWYKIDTNAVPFVYILQWISTILVNFNNKVRIIIRPFIQVWFDTHCQTHPTMKWCITLYNAH